MNALNLRKSAAERVHEDEKIRRRLRHEYLIADIKRRNHSATIMFLLATLALAALWAFVNF